MFEGSSGLQLNGQSLTVLMLGKMSASALTAVVFPDPFDPLINTPPILGLTAFRISASLRSSSETIAEKGKIVVSDIFPLKLQVGRPANELVESIALCREHSDDIPVWVWDGKVLFLRYANIVCEANGDRKHVIDHYFGAAAYFGYSGDFDRSSNSAYRIQCFQIHCYSRWHYDYGNRFLETGTEN